METVHDLFAAWCRDQGRDPAAADSMPAFLADVFRPEVPPCGPNCEHRGISSGTTSYGPYVGVCADKNCQCHFFYGVAANRMCKHFVVGRHTEGVWYCHECGQNFKPTSSEPERGR